MEVEPMTHDAGLVRVERPPEARLVVARKAMLARPHLRLRRAGRVPPAQAWGRRVETTAIVKAMFHDEPLFY